MGAERYTGDAPNSDQPQNFHSKTLMRGKKPR